MPRAFSRRSDASDLEPDGLAEQELEKLQRQYRIMEGDRKAYSEESQNVIRKQRSAIEALQLENEELTKENHLAGSIQNETKDTRNVDALVDLMGREEELKDSLNDEKDNINRLDSEIHAMERSISKKRKSMGGVHMSQAKLVAIQKQVRILENRLDQANRKFNAHLAENSKLREDIDHLRTERTIFEGLYKKLEKQMNDNKFEIAECIEASTSAYDGRDDAQGKMIALKEKSDKDLAQYNMELKELIRIIDHDRKLKEFMGVKGEDRSDYYGLTTSSAQRIAEREKQGDKEDTIESYESAFEKIKATTGIGDIDYLVDKFIEVEDKNFALFNYVNELNNETEMLQDQIAGVEADIHKFKSETVELEKQRKEILKDLEKRHGECEEEASNYEKKNTAVNKILEQLKTGISSTFTKINCDSSSVADMLDSRSGVTDANLIQYLGIVEQRTNELLQVQAFLAAKDEDRTEPMENFSLLGKGPQPLVASSSDAFGAGDEESDSEYSIPSEDESRPYTREELKARISKGTAKKNQAASARTSTQLNHSQLTTPNVPKKAIYS